jgi:hypothetical protein
MGAVLLLLAAMSPWMPSPRRCSQRAACAAALGLSCAALAGVPRAAAAEPPAKATVAPPAANKRAQRPPSASERERARQLVLEGDGLYERRELEQALARYAQAYRLVPVPTVGIEVVKAQMALGKLLEAQATAQEVAAAPRQRGEPAVFEDARRRAAQTNLRLSGIIPSLWLEVSPPGLVFEVEIDGVAPPGSPPYRLNPGAHQVRVRAKGYQTRLLAITVREAERLNRRAELVPEGAAGVAAAPAAGGSAAASLPAATPPAPARPAATTVPAGSPAAVSSSSAAGASAGSATASSTGAAPVDAAASTARSSSLRSLGWVGIGVAAVAAGAGTYAGIRAFSTKPDCPNDTCNPSQQDDLDASLRMGTIANVSVGVAVVTGALGIWALATASGESESSASLRELPVTVGLGKLNEIRVSGRF